MGPRASVHADTGWKRFMNTGEGERVERRLAAIQAANVNGYSRLTGADEEGTLTAERHECVAFSRKPRLPGTDERCRSTEQPSSFQQLARGTRIP